MHQAHYLADKVVETGRKLGSAQRLRGDALRRQGRWRDALAAYHCALSIQPQYPEVQMAVAQVYYYHGRPQRALSTLEALAGTYPSGEQPAEVYYWEGLTCAALGRYELAATQLAMAETRGMRSADLLYPLAEMRLQLGDFTAAAATLERALQLDPQHPAAERLCRLMRRDRRLARVPR